MTQNLVNLSTFDLNDKDIDDHGVFHLCAKKNNLDCLKYLMSLIVNEGESQVFNQKDKHDNTILHVCSMRGHFKMFKFILESRTFLKKNQNLVFCKNYYEQTCFHLACKEGHENIIRYVLKFLIKN